MFFFSKFLKNYELSKGMEKYHQFLNFLSYKYSLSNEDLLEDFKEFAKEEIDTLKQSTLDDDYKNFMDAKEDELQDEFNREHNFQTSVRLKIRGSFPTQEEAEMRCKMLRRLIQIMMFLLVLLVCGCHGILMLTRLDVSSLWKMSLTS